MSNTNLFPEHMPDLPLDDLPVPLVPGGFWDPEDEHSQIIEPEAPDYEPMVRSALAGFSSLSGNGMRISAFPR